MRRIFIDTNILIDFLARRESYFLHAASIMSLSSKGFQILVSSLSFATASYVLAAHHKMSPKAIKQLFENFIKICHITTVDAQTVNRSTTSGFNDFEDAMQYFSAISAHADVVVTRNKSDFFPAQIPVLEPQDFLNQLVVKQS